MTNTNQAQITRPEIRNGELFEQLAQNAENIYRVTLVINSIGQTVARLGLAEDKSDERNNETTSDIPAASRADVLTIIQRQGFAISRNADALEGLSAYLNKMLA